MTHLVRVWDSFVRAFHWILVLLLLGLWFTGGKIDYIDIHVKLGLFTLALLISRLMWGIVGSDSARFADFVRGPVRALRFLRDEVRGRNPELAGHNPAGGYMILLLLALVLAQALSGLFTNDDLFFMGPLAGWVDYDTQRLLTRFHGANFNWILIASVVHIIAIFIYMARNKDLITPMFSGKKKLSKDAAKPRIINGGIGFAIFIANLVWVFWWLG